MMTRIIVLVAVLLQPMSGEDVLTSLLSSLPTAFLYQQSSLEIGLSNLGRMVNTC